MDLQYSICKAYEQLMDDIPEVTWAPGIWNSMSLPKHRFIAWLGIHNKLKSKDKLLQFGVCVANLCYLCGDEVETHRHLFFECEFSKQLLIKMLRWIRITPNNISLP